MGSKEIWIVKGIGEDNPEKIKIGKTDTVGDIRRRYAAELGVQVDNVELSTDTTRLNNDNEILSQVVAEGETVNVLPRARAGID